MTRLSAAERMRNIMKKNEAERPSDRLKAACGFITGAGGVSLTLFVTLLFGLICSVACGSRAREEAETQTVSVPLTMANSPNAEAKSQGSMQVDPEVQSQIDQIEAGKRVTLLKDAQSALGETQSALAALDKGDKQAASAALERATGKLDVVVSRDPSLAQAPVSVATTLIDVYTTPDTVEAVVREAKDDLARDQVQQARLLMRDVASEADIHVTEIPLASYPAAIRAVAPLINAGKLDEAKAALLAALHTLVIETYVVPLPRVRAEAMLGIAETLASKSDRKPDDVKQSRALIEEARRQIQLAEVLGYGTADSYKPLYSQLNQIEKQVDSGLAARGLFDRLRQSLNNFKFST
jgi:CHASE3 domain sensor protein